MRDAPGPLIVDVAGCTLDAEDRDILRHPSVGGVILFSRNYEARGQLTALCHALHALRRGTPLLVTVDHEGGRVQRFREGFTELPSAAIHGDRYGTDATAATADAHAHGFRLAAELLEVGIDLSFAPVLDIGRGLGTVIGDRAFSSEPDAVTALGQAWIAGMHEAGMAACGKHFPGHGGVSGDSHDMLPVDDRPLPRIAEEDLVPFDAAIRAGVDAVMMAHVAYPAVDPLPASLSPTWIREILRGKYGFEGAVVCDDLSMGGAAGYGTSIDRARAALDAGCDMLPVCNDRAGVIEILDGLKPGAPAERAARLSRLRPGRRR